MVCNNFSHIQSLLCNNIKIASLAIWIVAKTSLTAENHETSGVYSLPYSVSFSQKLWLKNFYCIFFRTSCAITFQPIILMYRRCIYNFIVHSLITWIICMCGSEFTLKLDCGVAIFPNNLSLIIKLMCFLKLQQCNAL